MEKEEKFFIAQRRKEWKGAYFVDHVGSSLDKQDWKPAFIESHVSPYLLQIIQFSFVIAECFNIEL